jgi:hypothetical protein
MLFRLPFSSCRCCATRARFKANFLRLAALWAAPLPCVCWVSSTDETSNTQCCLIQFDDGRSGEWRISIERRDALGYYLKR